MVYCKCSIICTCVYALYLIQGIKKDHPTVCTNKHTYIHMHWMYSNRILCRNKIIFSVYIYRYVCILLEHRKFNIFKSVIESARHMFYNCEQFNINLYHIGSNSKKNNNMILCDKSILNKLVYTYNTLINTKT